MIRIPPSFTQEVLARTDIVEIIKARLTLIKRGDNYTAPCPFHEEKTPSFSVSQSKQFYYCFGCGASGNAIGFLIAYDRLPFREAVKELAQPLGLEIPSDKSAGEINQSQVLYDCMEKTTQFYQLTLRKAPIAINYLKGRGLSGMTAKTFAIGYAPSHPQQLENYFRNDSALKDALEPSGLIVKKPNAEAYDRFRDRIMFPIRNIQGQILGFGGRSLGDAKPKYLNSPETQLFHKGYELFGLYEARKQNSKFSYWIVVEGYMDVVTLHQYGLSSTVATLGTAVTSQQIQKLLHHTHHIVFCFDGDPAGRKAAWKALEISLKLLRGGTHIAFLILPEKEDPDSFIRKIGKEAFSKMADEAMPLPEFFFMELTKQIPLQTSADKAQFGQEAAKYLETMPVGLFRELMFKQLAKILDLETKILTNSLQPSTPPPKNELRVIRMKTQPRSRPLLLSPLHLLISLLLNQSNLASLVTDLEGLQGIDSSEKDLFLLIAQHFQQNPQLTTGELLALFDDETNQQLIAKLAARKSAVPMSGIHAEFLGALNSFKQQATEHSITLYVEKAKNQGLNHEEKQHLQTLLAKIKREASER